MKIRSKVAPHERFSGINNTKGTNFSPVFQSIRQHGGWRKGCNRAYATDFSRFLAFSERDLA